MNLRIAVTFWRVTLWIRVKPPANGSQKCFVGGWQLWAWNSISFSVSQSCCLQKAAFFVRVNTCSSTCRPWCGVAPSSSGGRVGAVGSIYMSKCPWAKPKIAPEAALSALEYACTLIPNLSKGYSAISVWMRVWMGESTLRVVKVTRKVLLTVRKWSWLDGELFGCACALIWTLFLFLRTNNKSTMITLTRQHKSFHFLGSGEKMCLSSRKNYFKSSNSSFSSGNMLMLNYRWVLKITCAQIFQEAVPKIFIYIYFVFTPTSYIPLDREKGGRTGLVDDSGSSADFWQAGIKAHQTGLSRLSIDRCMLAIWVHLLTQHYDESFYSFLTVEGG